MAEIFSLSNCCGTETSSWTIFSSWPLKPQSSGESSSTPPLLRLYSSSVTLASPEIGILSWMRRLICEVWSGNPLPCAWLCFDVSALGAVENWSLDWLMLFAFQRSEAWQHAIVRRWATPDQAVRLGLPENGKLMPWCIPHIGYAPILTPVAIPDLEQCMHPSRNSWPRDLPYKSRFSFRQQLNYFRG